MAYNILFPFHFLVSGDMSGNITSSVLEIREQDNIGFQLSWTGAPVGAFSVQVSVNHRQDGVGNVTVPGTWVTIPNSPSVSASGSPDGAYIDINQISAPYIRIIYSRVSGSGVLDGHVIGKGV